MRKTLHAGNVGVLLYKCNLYFIQPTPLSCRPLPAFPDSFSALPLHPRKN